MDFYEDEFGEQQEFFDNGFNDTGFAGTWSPEEPDIPLDTGEIPIVCSNLTYLV